MLSSKKTQFYHPRLHSLIFISVLILISSAAIFRVQAAPDESSYTEFTPPYSTVPPDYIWNIKFSHAVDSYSAQSGISVYEMNSSGEPVPFDIIPALSSSDSSIVKLNHSLNFDESASYKLFIDPSIKNSSGESLSQPTMMSFSILPASSADFSATASGTLKMISNDQTDEAKEINSTYPYIEVKFNRQIHKDTLALDGGLLQEFGGVTSGGMPHSLYVNGKLTDATIVAFKWEDTETSSPILNMEVRGAYNIDQDSTVKFSFKPNLIKDISGEYLPSEELSHMLYNFSTPKPDTILLPEKIYDGSIKNDPTNGGNGHIQIYFPSGTDLRPIIAMDRDLVMIKSDGTKYTAHMHIDGGGIMEYGIYNIMDVNIDVPFEIGDTFTFSGLDGTNLSSLSLTVTELH